jgi:DNA-binding MarR family transcriptional regulator
MLNQGGIAMRKTPTEPASHRIAVLIERLGRLARNQRYADGLNPAQWEALSYLAIANRYSRTPSAVAEFLGATKGTVSQTLIALEKKGLITRRPGVRDRRGVVLDLARAGRTRVAMDPLRDFEIVAQSLDPTTQRTLAEHLTGLLTAMQRRNRFHTFGICQTCRFFHRDDASGERGGPHRCGLTLEPLSEPEIVQICREHEPKVA